MASRTTLTNFICTLISIVVLYFSNPILSNAAIETRISEDEMAYQKAYLLLSTKAYKELEARFKQYLDNYARNEITEEELAKKFETFSKTPGLEPRYDEWIKAYPESYSAMLARGIYRATTAWERRGNDLARNTTDSQFRGFREMLIDAKSDLTSSIKLYPRAINSYRYLIRISKGLGLGDERKFLDAALLIDSKAYNPRFEYFDAITPKWGGSEELMAQFLKECQKSPMSDQSKQRIEGKYYYSLGQQASFDKDYKTTAHYFYKYYLTNHDPANLQKSGQALLDGDYKDQAFERFNELVKDHPQYQYGYELRGYLYEYHLKDIEKSTKDYLTAANMGANWSQNRMGWYYMMGINIPVNYSKAKHYLELAAAQGNVTAKENLVTLKKLLARPNTDALH